MSLASSLALPALCKSRKLQLSDAVGMLMPEYIKHHRLAHLQQTSFAPDSVMQLCTLGKKLSMKIDCTAAENCASRVVGVVRQHFKGPSRRAEPFACLADCRSPWVPAARARRRKSDAKIRHFALK
ncbi:hypothetical protein QJQ45_028076 [Haematococcus lacustris]|nr:hypothetical protein QJQ45_028076 [Haematococcus lacustris]